MSTSAQQEGHAHRAGAFDVRNVIAALLGFYGAVLLIMGLVDATPQQLAKTGGVNADLWAGLGMLVVALAFAVWARLRPVVVDEAEIAEARAAAGVAEEEHPAAR